ncbi:MAG: hypothetical protein ACF8QF_06990 [Phycisphaerales bacterium]
MPVDRLHHETRPRTRRAFSTRTAGYAVAGAVLAGVIGLVAWSVATAPGQAPEQPLDAPPAPTIADRPAVDPENIQDVIAGADEGRIELVDEQNRVVQELFYDEFTPQEAGRFHVTKPRAWLYLERGRTVVIDADTLNFSQQRTGQEPESGRFSGSVRVRVYDAAGGVQHRAPRTGEEETRPEPEPSLTLATDALVFDTAIGELGAPGLVEITAPGLRARFEGLDLLVDQRGRRLALLRTERDGFVRITPAELQRAETTPGESGGQGAPADEAPTIDFYRAEFDSGVRVAMGGRTLASDRLDLWARLVGGALPDGAIAGFDQPADERATTNDTARSQSAPEAVEEITVAWAGALTVRPEAQQPQALAQDDLAMRFTAPTSGLVEIDDRQTGASARAATLDYGLTTRRLALTGVGETGVAVRVPGDAELLAGRLELNLTTGVGAVPGPGVLRSLAEERERQRQRITWRERSDFILATAGGLVDLRAASPIEEAIFAGAAEARYGDAFVTGEFIRAELATTPTGAPTISRVFVEGGAAADAGDDGALLARRVEVEFDTEATEPTPTLDTAEGAVRAERDGASLEGELVEATVVRLDDGELAVSDLTADLGVLVRTPEGAELSGDELRAQVQEGVFDITGQPAILRQDNAAITGESMRIEANTERLTVFGAGVLNYARPSREGVGYERAQVEWSGSMRYDGTRDEVEFSGDCIATAELDALSRDRAEAERIVVSLTPDTQPAPRAGGAVADAQGAIQRVLLYGASHEGAGDEPVQVESRQYVRDPEADTGLRLESVVFLESRSIDARIAQNDLLVPHPGRLLIENRQEGGESTDEDAASVFDVRGSTLFEWEGDLVFDRDNGSAVMSRQVRLRQLPPGGDEMTELECERLTAQMTLPSDPNQEAELRSAEASGAVYVRRGTRQLIADRLLYDASTGVAEATAALGNAVTLFDANNPTPLTGSLLRWDLVRDRLEWRDAGAATTPR